MAANICYLLAKCYYIFVLLLENVFHSQYIPYVSYFHIYVLFCDDELYMLKSNKLLFCSVITLFKQYIIIWKITCALRYIQWTIPFFLYQTRRKNALVHKGLSYYTILSRKRETKARMRRLGCAFVVHMQQNRVFS